LRSTDRGFDAQLPERLAATLGKSLTHIHTCPAPLKLRQYDAVEIQLICLKF